MLFANAVFSYQNMRRRSKVSEGKRVNKPNTALFWDLLLSKGEKKYFLTLNFPLFQMAGPEGFEPSIFRSEAGCLIRARPRAHANLAPLVYVFSPGVSLFLTVRYP